MLNWKQIGIIIFLILVVIGFAVPGILNDTENNVRAEQRYCQTDAECYLTCEEIPKPVICLQNICQQNACAEKSYYNYNETPITFNLEVKRNNITEELSKIYNSQNVFVTYSDSLIKVYTTDLTLKYILEKFNLPNQGFNLSVNGEHSYAYENYIPKEGDKLNIIYE